MVIDRGSAPVLNFAHTLVSCSLHFFLKNFRFYFARGLTRLCWYSLHDALFAWHPLRLLEAPTPLSRNMIRKTLLSVRAAQCHVAFLVSDETVWSFLRVLQEWPLLAAPPSFLPFTREFLIDLPAIRRKGTSETRGYQAS